MVTFSSVFEWVIAPSNIGLELALLLISYRRRLYRQLVFFSAYVVLLNLLEVVGWCVAPTHWFISDGYRDIYWGTQFVLSLLRLLTIAEISRRSLRGYPTVWTLSWQILSASALILLSWTTYSAIQNVHHFERFIGVGGQRFECMQAILLLLLFVLGIYYHVRIPPLYRWILIGICIYSALEVANSQFYLLKSALGDSMFAYIRRGSFPISLAIWTYAVWRWGDDSNNPPELISQSQYDDLSPKIHDRLRDLNDKLSDLTGKRPR